MRRFFRTPKGLLLAVLVLMLALAMLLPRVHAAVWGLVLATVVAGLLDTLILRILHDAWEFPSGAVLTALIVAMVLSPQVQPFAVLLTTLVAIVAKWCFRTRTANIFNPAAFALVATFYVFHTTQDWWGALPDLGPWGLAVLFVGGIVIAGRVNKLPLVLVFLGAYYAFVTAAAYLGNPQNVAELFRTPDLQAALFFAFFILTDPPTSPPRYRDQVVCALIVAIAGFAFFLWVGTVYYLLAGVLVGNAWEAWRRVGLVTRNRSSAAALT